jgi:serine/threonine-protein kinase
VDDVEFGRYRLIALLGEGGMGKVYRAHDTLMDREVAIKVLPPEMASEPGYEQRFRREAYTAARVNEPHIVPIFEAGEIDGRLYLVMPVIEGTDVHDLLQREGPMRPERAVHVIDQLASALTAAHAAGLVHRDIKPSNALVTGNDFVYLIDFGIAHTAGATKLTSTGMLVGTMSYMAPERFMAAGADARSDVYSLACVLHECLTGATPFPGDSMEQQIAGHLTLAPPRPSVQKSGVPAGFDDVIAHGMAKDPEQRYQSPRDLATAARDALAGRRTSTAPANRPAPPPQSARPPHAPARPPQRPVSLNFVAAQPPAAPAPPPRSGLRPAHLAIAAVVGVVVLLATAGITMKLAEPHSSTAQTPAVQPVAPSGATAQPAPPSAPTGAPAPAPKTAVVPNTSTTYVKLEGIGVCQVSTSDAVCQGTWPQAPVVPCPTCPQPMHMDQAVVDTNGTFTWRDANLGHPQGGRQEFTPTVGQPFHNLGWTAEVDGSGGSTFTYDATGHGMKITWVVARDASHAEASGF